MTTSSHGRVVVVGSINQDLRITVAAPPRSGETVLAEGMLTEHGGKGANQAVAAARTGARVTFVGAVGDDGPGRSASAQLEAEGVDTSGLAVLGDSFTGMAVVLVADTGENQIVVVSGANAEIDPAHVADTLSRLSLTATDVCMTGFEIGDGVLATTAAVAAATGCRFIVNPAPARPIPETVLAAHPLLVPNRGEASDLTGADDPRDAARELYRRASAPVVITVGAEGALLFDGTRFELVAADPVTVVDTTGAGDTFAGVFSAHLAGGASDLEAVRAGVAAASSSVTRPGARGIVR